MTENEQGQTQVVEKKSSMDEKQERTLGMLCHLGGLLGWLPPLIIWLLKKDEAEFVNDQGKESPNFQISVTIYYAAAAILSFSIILTLVGIPLLFAVAVFDLVMIIIASINANKGEKYRYPLCIRFIK